MLDRLFRLAESGTTVRTEVIAGTTTFLTMAYIIFVQPAVLSAAGMDAGAVLTATCLATAIATLIMALAANYPFAVAPAMGHNFFFAFTVVVAGGTPWPVALGAVAIAGAIFILTAGFGLRERVMRALPESFKHAIGVGIGLLIALDRPGVGRRRRRLAGDARHARIVPVGARAPRRSARWRSSAVLHARAGARRGADRHGGRDRRGPGARPGAVQGVVSMPPSLAPTFLSSISSARCQPGLDRRGLRLLLSRAVRFDRHARRAREPDRARARAARFRARGRRSWLTRSARSSAPASARRP